MKFELKEDSSDAKSSSEDSQTNFLLDNLDDSEEEIDIFDEDEITGEKTKSQKSYKIGVVDDRIGFKIRLEDKFYD
jgi:hypothetical protein